DCAAAGSAQQINAAARTMPRMVSILYLASRAVWWCRATGQLGIIACARNRAGKQALSSSRNPPKFAMNRRRRAVPGRAATLTRPNPALHLRSSLEHDLFRKPVSTFRDHALAPISAKAAE